MVALRGQGNWRWEGPLGTPLGLVHWKRASSPVEAGNPGYPSTCAGDLRGLLMVALRSQGNWRWEGPLGTPLGLVSWKRASSPVEAGTSGFLGFQTPLAGSLQTGDRRVRPRLALRHGTPLACRGVFGTWGSFPDDARAGHCPFVLTSFTGWSSERRPGIGFLPRGDREIGVLRNVEAPTRPRLECRREHGLILRCDRKVGNPFQDRKSTRLNSSHQLRSYAVVCLKK